MIGRFTSRLLFAMGLILSIVIVCAWFSSRSRTTEVGYHGRTWCASVSTVPSGILLTQSTPSKNFRRQRFGEIEIAVMLPLPFGFFHRTTTFTDMDRSMFWNSADIKRSFFGLSFAAGSPNYVVSRYAIEVIPYPACLALTMGLSAIVSIPILRRWRRSRRGQCLGCGYDLRASTDRCPECGLAILSAKT
jgi:hypothetical protein